MVAGARKHIATVYSARNLPKKHVENNCKGAIDVECETFQIDVHDDGRVQGELELDNNSVDSGYYYTMQILFYRQKTDQNPVAIKSLNREIMPGNEFDVITFGFDIDKKVANGGIGIVKIQIAPTPFTIHVVGFFFALFATLQNWLSLLI